MSSDSAKENASVVDSSVTEWKLDFGNSDDTESSIHKANADSYPIRKDKMGHSHRQIGVPTGIEMDKLYNARYFIIKSLNQQNIRLSVEKGIWATQIMNEPILEEAFHNSFKVILIFSVNMSGSFQGYAQMMSPIGWRRDNVWSEGSGKSNPWGRSFKVKWLRLNDLPFHKTPHLNNPLNGYKPVKISRDCQELSPEIGEALCELLDGKNNVDLVESLSRDSYSLKGHHAETPSSLGNKDCSFAPLHMSWSLPLPYPTLLYQNQAEVNRFQAASQRFSETTFTETVPINYGLSTTAAGTKRSHFSGHISKLQVGRDAIPQFDVWGLSAESPLASSLTEDDFLDMSYEEYLEVHSRCRKQLCFSATTSWVQLQSMRSKSRGDDRNSDSVRNRSSSP